MQTSHPTAYETMRLMGVDPIHFARSLESANPITAGAMTAWSTRNQGTPFLSGLSRLTLRSFPMPKTNRVRQLAQAAASASGPSNLKRPFSRSIVVYWIAKQDDSTHLGAGAGSGSTLVANPTASGFVTGPL